VFPDVDVRQLQAVVVLAEELNFTRASQILGISQPALSKQITEIEAQYQMLLVHPARQCDQQKPERVQGFRHEESNFITESPAVEGPGGYPIAVYADRFSGP
jgi:Bacterial regulatory helix-turn-helix protein, lysR family